ncbi:hypothetical protein HYH03_018161 [Edaphochlamys debaryana]|uniref:SnoaL-like domain-containing protein n=1 Tax=Edaphochlamys debaryana TaxID=47281 RepID=A0A836BN72_9CHLO|nr:hypothetical protein HYH03_018161 [Edaphochlamys debaryana]|eukprot:KAG2482936.1 hypothetical protein HYH03_018161 [Edaphochlamys debaryana]
MPMPRSRLVIRASATPAGAQEQGTSKRREVLGALSLASAGSVLSGVAAPLLPSAIAAPDPAAVLLDAYAKFGDFQASGDPAKYKVFETTFTDDISWESNVNGGFKGKGKADVARFFKFVNTYNAISKFEPFKLVAQGNEVVSLVNLAGKGALTGTQYSTTVVHVATISPDGKIAKFREICDSALINAALGAPAF